MKSQCNYPSFLITINIFILIIIILISYDYYKHLSNAIKYIVDKKEIKNTEVKLEKKYNIEDNIDFLQNRDLDVKYNPFAPPERRHTEDFMISSLINYPSRGFPDNYQLLGILTKESFDNQPKDNIPIYNLYGRPTFPRSNQYEYFIEGVFNNMPIKIPVKNKKELYDGDIINIPELEAISKNFKIKLYDYYQPKYNPYNIDFKKQLY